MTSDGERRESVGVSEEALVEKEFGLPVEPLYRAAIKYYKEHESKGDLVLSYDERLKFMALSKQIKCGPYDESQNDSGWFDFVGNDRTKAWRELGDLSRTNAMTSFVFLLDRVCPPFKQFVHEQLLSPQEAEEAQQLQANGNDERVKPDWQILESHKKQIQEALNAQTYHQFLAYAQQQLPANPEQQAALIQQLQEQHYQQYMAQVFQQAEQAGGEVVEQVNEEEQRKRDDDSDISDEEPGDDIPSNPAISPASLWNRQDIQEFKNTIKKEGSEGIIKVGHGETVTVRVPTHEEGTCLFWEFATDNYDIGFGVLFEWTIAESNQISVQVSESSDEEIEEETAVAEAPPGIAPGDVESGNPQKEKKRDPNKPHQDEIIPVYRRDCHEEVYAGSHQYPGRGVYLLKFDNSYSLWRSKTLYYRVYYSK